MIDDIKQSLLARVYDVAEKSPLEYAAGLSARLNTTVHLKREELQPVHSFKIRGAYNKIVQLTEAEKARGVIAASAGNHAQGVALSAAKLGITATIVMPQTTPLIKIEAVRSYGAEVVLHGDNYSEAFEHCQSLIASSGKVFIHPFDDPLVIAGQGTIGKEILEDLPTVTHIFVPVGGGGLLAGVAQYVKNLRPEVTIIGVEPEDSNAMQLSLKVKKRITLDHVGIFADGVAVKQVGKNTFAAAQRYVDSIITVDNDAICAAIKDIFEATRGVVEPAGALAVAGMTSYAAEHDLSDAQVVAINSGANMSFERLQYVAERTLLGSGREGLFAIQLPEQPGSLKKLCETVVGSHAITEFNYRFRNHQQAEIFVGIQFGNSEQKQAFTSLLNTKNYVWNDLSHDELAKEHVRHMIGGVAPVDNQEVILHVNFPERPGALRDFLAAIADRWNISLFHYRGQGGDVGRVLIGFECSQKAALLKAIASTGYEYTDVSAQASIRLFL